MWDTFQNICVENIIIVSLNTAIPSLLLFSYQRLLDVSINGLFTAIQCLLRNFGKHIVIALSVSPSVPFRVRCISPRFFEVGIPNLVCGYILARRSVAYHFRVTATLTSDLVFRIIVSGAYLLYYLR